MGKSSRLKGPAKPAGKGRSERSSWQLPVVVLLVCFGAYLSNGAPLPEEDARGNMLVALNLLKRDSFLIAPPHAPTSFSWTFKRTSGNMTDPHITDWDDEKAEHDREGHLKPRPPYYLAPTVHPGRYANVFGIGAALPVFPVYAALNLVTDLASNHVLRWHSTKVTASLLTAGAALFIFLTMRQFVPPLPAALGALAFGLGTSAWPLSSQAAWRNPRHYAPVIPLHALQALTARANHRHDVAARPNRVGTPHGAGGTAVSGAGCGNHRTKDGGMLCC